MSTPNKVISVKLAASAPPAGQQPITAGTQVIERPTANTSTDHALKEA